jgi:hypothetical protein
MMLQLKASAAPRFQTFHTERPLSHSIVRSKGATWCYIAPFGSVWIPLDPIGLLDMHASCAKCAPSPSLPTGWRTRGHPVMTSQKDSAPWSLQSSDESSSTCACWPSVLPTNLPPFQLSPARKGHSQEANCIGRIALIKCAIAWAYQKTSLGWTFWLKRVSWRGWGWPLLKRSEEKRKLSDTRF